MHAVIERQAPARDEAKERIVDAALALAEERSWERVRLYEVADVLGMRLEEVRRHFREKEEVAEAWFDRADRALLEAADSEAFRRLPPRDRVHRAIMGWLDALSPHRRITREMVQNKLEPGHVHVQLAGLLRVSRTVQWVREAARRDASHGWRALEESVLTSIYLATFAYWLYDDSSSAQRTRRFLDRLLAGAERCGRLVPLSPWRRRGARGRPSGPRAGAASAARG